MATKINANFGKSGPKMNEKVDGKQTKNSKENGKKAKKRQKKNGSKWLRSKKLAKNGGKMPGNG